MGIFAAYELFRSRPQRWNEIIKWSDSGGLETRLGILEKDEGWAHFGRQFRADQIKKVLEAPELMEAIRRDLERTHAPFVRLEAIRVSLAKHAVRQRRGSGEGWAERDDRQCICGFEGSKEFFVWIW